MSPDEKNSEVLEYPKKGELLCHSLEITREIQVRVNDLGNTGKGFRREIHKKQTTHIRSFVWNTGGYETRNENVILKVNRLFD